MFRALTCVCKPSSEACLSLLHNCATRVHAMQISICQDSLSALKFSQFVHWRRKLVSLHSVVFEKDHLSILITLHTFVADFKLYVIICILLTFAQSFIATNNCAAIRKSWYMQQIFAGLNCGRYMRSKNQFSVLLRLIQNISKCKDFLE